MKHSMLSCKIKIVALDQIVQNPKFSSIAWELTSSAFSQLIDTSITVHAKWTFDTRPKIQIILNTPLMVASSYYEYEHVHLAAVRVISAYASWLAAEEWAPLDTTTPVLKTFGAIFKSRPNFARATGSAPHVHTHVTAAADNLNRRGRARADSSDVQNFVPIRVITTAIGRIPWTDNVEWMPSAIKCLQVFTPWSSTCKFLAVLSISGGSFFWIAIGAKPCWRPTWLIGSKLLQR